VSVIFSTIQILDAAPSPTQTSPQLPPQQGLPTVPPPQQENPRPTTAHLDKQLPLLVLPLPLLPLQAPRQPLHLPLQPVVLRADPLDAPLQLRVRERQAPLRAPEARGRVLCGVKRQRADARGGLSGLLPAPLELGYDKGG
jgi:hypothetical protein